MFFKKESFKLVQIKETVAIYSTHLHHFVPNADSIVHLMAENTL